MKLLGALLILMGTSSIGFITAQKIILRPKQLQQLKTALEMLKTEIDYGITPLPIAFEKLANNLATPISDIFLTAKENIGAGQVAQVAWENAVSIHISKLALVKKDQEMLLEIGYNLGNSNSSDQIRHLNLAQEKINHLYQEAVKEEEEKVKLWRYCGVLIGLLIVIIIV